MYVEDQICVASVGVLDGEEGGARAVGDEFSGAGVVVAWEEDWSFVREGY